ncbi:MAG TPA: hypothetical protein VGQ83_20305 [Polyangia bacterium]
MGSLAVVIGLVVVAAVAGAALLARRRRGAGATAASLAGADRGALAARLRDLARTPGPAQVADFAAALAAPPPVTEYVCPLCNNRTLYPRPAAPNGAAERDLLGEIATIDATRRLVEQAAKLAGGGVALDETQLCKHCSPRIAVPALTLVVALAGEAPRRLDGVGRDDVAVLLAFLRGARGDADGRAAARGRHGERLGRLLGVSPE